MLIIFLAKYLIIIFVCYLVYLFISGKAKIAIAATIAAVLAKLSEMLVGRIYYVPRPFVLNPELPYYTKVIEGQFSHFLGESRIGGDASFFSAHAATAFAIATVVYLLHSKTSGIILLLLAFLVALGRVLANVHYPIDVIIGAGVGIGYAFLIRNLTVSTLYGKVLNKLCL